MGELGQNFDSLRQAKNRKVRGSDCQALKGRNWVRRERRQVRPPGAGV